MKFSDIFGTSSKNLFHPHHIEAESLIYRLQNFLTVLKIGKYQMHRTKNKEQALIRAKYILSNYSTTCPPSYGKGSPLLPPSLHKNLS